MLRYKTAAENAEKVEDELKAEKRKLQREVPAFACSLSYKEKILHSIRNWILGPVLRQQQWSLLLFSVGF